MNMISIIGAGSHTRSSINLLKDNFKESIFGIYDDSFNDKNKELIDDIYLQGNIKSISNDSDIFLSIGDNKSRKLLFNKFNKQIIKENLFHKTSYLESDIIIGNSNQVFANTYINSFVSIRDNNIINTSAILEHEVKIGSHNHISVGAKLCGRVIIGNNCMVGAGAIIIDKISICDDVILGAGTVVIKNISKSGTYVGNPARKVK
ncbi:MAG: acetyltransferase [Campylobacterota bacterium]|nr:acetyltransferase [Campylobacterota bacterium]